jgi:hypothetical protein
MAPKMALKSRQGGTSEQTGGQHNVQEGVMGQHWGSLGVTGAHLVGRGRNECSWAEGDANAEGRVTSSQEDQG